MSNASGIGDPVTDPNAAPPSIEGTNVETYEQYVVRTHQAGELPKARVDWARESGSGGGAGPNGPVGPAGPADQAATSADSILVDNHERTDYSVPAGVTRVAIEGTQIDPRDGVRKPVDQIEREEPPTFDTVDASGQGAVFIDRRNTQIGPDGLRHPIDGSGEGPTARTNG